MSTSEYIKIYSGSFIFVTRLRAELEHIGITPVIKDEGESQRLAGYGSMNQGIQDVFVHQEELKNASDVLERVRAELEA